MPFQFVLKAERATDAQQQKKTYGTGHIDVLFDGQLVIRLYNFSLRFSPKNGNYFIAAPSRSVDSVNPQSGQQEKRWLDQWKLFPNDRQSSDGFGQWALQEFLKQVPDPLTPAQSYARPQAPQQGYAPQGQPQQYAPQAPQMQAPQAPQGYQQQGHQQQGPPQGYAPQAPQGFQAPPAPQAPQPPQPPQVPQYAPQGPPQAPQAPQGYTSPGAPPMHAPGTPPFPPQPPPAPGVPQAPPAPMRPSANMPNNPGFPLPG